MTSNLVCQCEKPTLRPFPAGLFCYNENCGRPLRAVEKLGEEKASDYCFGKACKHDGTKKCALLQNEPQVSAWKKAFDKRFVTSSRAYVGTWWRTPIGGQAEIASPVQVKPFITTLLTKALSDERAKVETECAQKAVAMLAKARTDAFEEAEKCIPRENSEKFAMNDYEAAYDKGFNACRSQMLQNLEAKRKGV